MILKKDAPSYVIWALFAAFNVLLIAVFGLYSGLFPTSDTTETMLFTGLFTVLVGGTCLVVSFLIDRLSVYFMQSKEIDSDLLYRIIFVLILIGGICLRGYILYKDGFYIKSGNLLFQTASVTNGGVIKAEALWKLFYLVLMRVVLYFTGDIEVAALVYQMVIRILFFVLIGIAVKIMTGRISSLIVLSFLMFLPPFITVHILDATSFFELFVALEFIFLALYFRSMTRPGKKSVVRFFLYFLLGICLGALLYMDAGTILLWGPMILLLFDIKKIKKVLLSFLCIIIGAVSGFVMTLICWDGYKVICPAFDRWYSKYFTEVLSIESFEVIGESSSSVYAALYLILAIIMLSAVFAFLFHKNTTRLTPVMLAALLVCLLAPIMGETNINTLRMMTLMCIIVIGGGIACMLTSYDTSDFDLLLGDIEDKALEFDEAEDTAESGAESVETESEAEAGEAEAEAEAGEAESGAQSDEDESETGETEPKEESDNGEVESEAQSGENKSEENKEISEENIGVSDEIREITGESEESLDDEANATKAKTDTLEALIENDNAENFEEAIGNDNAENFEEAIENDKFEDFKEISEDNNDIDFKENSKDSNDIDFEVNSKDSKDIEFEENSKDSDDIDFKENSKDSNDIDFKENSKVNENIDKNRDEKSGAGDILSKTLENNSDVLDNTTETENIIRYVPEGMVVPMDTEVDETPRLGRKDILERRRNISKMRNPYGKLKVGRKVITDREFDIEVTDGDDFDLF
ncbi:MAG: hypothetical protein K6G87_17700 [Butyrivibrio sp.]|uniref:hypothetical protein n=1 Tax=Butyrivibrio sp. TaxID=28121 RepID=UPI0025F66D72|nr:hypothetical protein [Butyrivibrio sp.]MCR5773061.1 hypothetical protein [Butyrivibrio sp.]